MKTTVARWSSAVNEDFKFTFKLFKELTHVKNLNFDNLQIENFIQTISQAGAKKGCLLVQFPPSLKKENIHQLDNLLNQIKIADSMNLWNVALEFRNKGWYDEEVYDLLASYKAALVIHDKQEAATPFQFASTPFIYIRFHGPAGNYRGSYTDDFLLEYAEYINEWLKEGKTVYVYFNNTMGNAFNNLVTLNNFVI